MELDDDLYARILKLSAQGDQHLDDGQHEAAVQKYQAAWDLLPEPKESWKVALWLLVSLGETYWLWGRLQDTIRIYSRAAGCPDGLGNPLIHLRLGEAHFDLGALPTAKQELTRAYMGGGREIFSTEDPKYFEVLRDLLIPPAGKEEL